MLANYLVENFTEFSFIDWSMVVARPEFSGHTEKSLKSIYSHLRYHSSLRFNVMSSEVTLQQVVDYSEVVYGEGAQGRVKGASDNKLGCQKEVIAFFEGKVKELGIVHFL